MFQAQINGYEKKDGVENIAKTIRAAEIENIPAFQVNMIAGGMYEFFLTLSQSSGQRNGTDGEPTSLQASNTKLKTSSFFRKTAKNAVAGEGGPSQATQDGRQLEADPRFNGKFGGRSKNDPLQRAVLPFLDKEFNNDVLMGYIKQGGAMRKARGADATEEEEVLDPHPDIEYVQPPVGFFKFVCKAQLEKIFKQVHDDDTAQLGDGDNITLEEGEEYEKDSDED